MIKKIREYIRRIIIEAYDPDDVHELDDDDLLIEPDVKEKRKDEKEPYADVYQDEIDEEVDEASVAGGIAGFVGPAFSRDPERKY